MLNRVFLAQTLLGLLLVYFAGISLFSHSHTIDGLTIVHSHPFSSESDNDHSDEEYLLIAALSDYISPELGQKDIIPELPFVQKVEFIRIKTSPNFTNSLTCPDWRAPPVS